MKRNVPAIAQLAPRYDSKELRYVLKLSRDSMEDCRRKAQGLIYNMQRWADVIAVLEAEQKRRKPKKFRSTAVKPKEKR